MYEDIIKFVKDKLQIIDDNRYLPFRKRSEHIMRVFMWVKRLADGEYGINKEAVLISSLFHDIGYSLDSDNSVHAENSAIICERYLQEKDYDIEFINFVRYLVKNHSDKKLMTVDGTPSELIMLMEADLLDEMGAMSIVWDCMAEGASQKQSYEKTYNRISDYSYKLVNTNPMVSVKAKAFWQNKQNLMKEFIEQLSFDLEINTNYSLFQQNTLSDDTDVDTTASRMLTKYIKAFEELAK